MDIKINFTGFKDKDLTYSVNENGVVKLQQGDIVFNIMRENLLRIAELVRSVDSIDELVWLY